MYIFSLSCKVFDDLVMKLLKVEIVLCMVEKKVVKKRFLLSVICQYAVEMCLGYEANQVCILHN